MNQVDDDAVPERSHKPGTDPLREAAWQLVAHAACSESIEELDPQLRALQQAAGFPAAATDLATEVERLRAALEQIAKNTDRHGPMRSVWASETARTALDITPAS